MPGDYEFESRVAWRAREEAGSVKAIDLPDLGDGDYELLVVHPSELSGLRVRVETVEPSKVVGSFAVRKNQAEASHAVEGWAVCARGGRVAFENVAVPEDDFSVELHVRRA